MNGTRTCASIPRIHGHCCGAPECPALFRLTPFGPRDPARRGETAPQPPLRLSRFLLRVVRERRGGRGSKEAGGGAAAPCLLRSTSPPPASPPQKLNSSNCRGRGRGWGQFMTAERKEGPDECIRDCFTRSLLAGLRAGLRSGRWPKREAWCDAVKRRPPLRARSRQATCAHRPLNGARGRA